MAATAPRFSPRPLLMPNLSRSRDARNLKKPVYARRLIDDMEGAAGWQATPAVAMSFTNDRSRTGNRSLRMTVRQRDEGYIERSRQPNGSFSGAAILLEAEPSSAVLTRYFSPHQDWTAFNRLSIWCYVHPGNPIYAIALELLCEGAPAGPSDPIAVNYIGDLEPGRWNQLVWEISEYPRDKVSQFRIVQPIWGAPIAGSNPLMTLDFDQLELHQVDVEPVSGWAVSPGQIAYSHVGYLPQTEKVAIAADGPETTFDVLGSDGGQIATLSAEPITTPRGRFRRLDFSKVAQPGTYRLRYGSVGSEPFPITARALADVAEPVLNAFYGLRCGWKLPGIHDACHTDVFVEYRGERRSLGGGWHDAANLTQSANNSHLAIYALAELADALDRQGTRAGAASADEEMRWGVEWSLRMRFGPGLRCGRDNAAYYTDAISGTSDDVVTDGARAVRKDDWANILAALACARAARRLRPRDPAYAALLQRAAAEDLAEALPELEAPTHAQAPTQMNMSSGGDRLAYATLALVELFRLRPRDALRQKAKHLAARFARTQQRALTPKAHITGWFFEDEARERPIHEFHSSFEDARILAWEALCDTFPDDPDWMDWYAGLTLHSHYFCRAGSETTAPYGLLPAAIWRRRDLDSLPPDPMGTILAAKPSPLFPIAPSPEIITRQMEAMFQAGVDLGDEHRLRVFPLWFDHVRHGSTVIHLAKATALASAARARQSDALQGLARRQLEWILGANPFSRSLMYGVGKDWWRNFTVELPNLVGGLSLGMNSYADDAPAWGSNAVFPYKELWIVAEARAALFLARLMDPPAPAAHFDLTATPVETGSVRVTLHAPASEVLKLRAYNLIGAPDHPVQIPAGGRHSIELRIVDLATPWIVSAVAKGGARRDATGAVVA